MAATGEVVGWVAVEGGAVVAAVAVTAEVLGGLVVVCGGPALVARGVVGWSPFAGPGAGRPELAGRSAVVRGGLVLVAPELVGRLAGVRGGWGPVPAASELAAGRQPFTEGW
ncbi:hypothetical protein [Streptomyces sp. NPDC048425]|uniref:hypothetical protein n=1 Tax=Streptomyces sp. NPDC048425 TaxID=3365548 RepID=UPI0037184BBD